MSDDKKKTNQDQDQPENKRRKVLKSAALGAGALGTVAPQNWSKPVIDSMILPAHAQTSKELRAGL